MKNWCPGEASNLDSKFLRNQSLNAVGLFELPRKLPSSRKHWRDIRWYRVLSLDTCPSPRSRSTDGRTERRATRPTSAQHARPERAALGNQPFRSTTLRTHCRRVRGAVDPRCRLLEPD